VDATQHGSSSATNSAVDLSRAAALLIPSPPAEPAANEHNHGLHPASPEAQLLRSEFSLLAQDRELLRAQNEVLVAAEASIRRACDEKIRELREKLSAVR
jgi:hypothetical protein